MVNIQCDWHINTQQRGTIIIDIVFFQVEQDFDFLDVGKGPYISDDSRIIRMTGNWAPNKIIIPDAEAAWLSFHSDALMADLGFELQLHLTSESGKLGNYKNQLGC